jgi:uncharacterized membrane protein YdjX (TVP38/TMEM64 family)
VRHLNFKAWFLTIFIGAVISLVGYFATGTAHYLSYFSGLLTGAVLYALIGFLLSMGKSERRGYD